jgi:ketosteroid isomerase-like protein
MTHDEHPNLALFREIQQKMQAGGIRAMADYMADDVVWHEIGRAEPIRGKEALAARYAESGDWVGDLSFETHATLADDEHVVELVTATVTRDGEPFVYRTCEIYHVRDGKITERWAFSDDTERINRFFQGA